MTIVEMLVASLLLLVLMGAALSTVTITVVESRQTRATDIASSLATAQVEVYRSFTFDSIALDANDATIPDEHEGLTVHKSTDCATCPVHVETISDASGDFTVTRWVLEVDDATDGTGALDEDAEPLDYKRVIIDVAWTHARGGTTTITTNILRDGTQPFAAPQGVTFEIVNDATPPERIEDTEDEFPLTVTMDGEDYTGSAAEGLGTVNGVPAGLGSCVVTAPSILWETPVGSNSHLQNCTVTEDAIVSVTSSWVFVPCNDGLGSGTSVVTVEDGGSPVVGATVDVTQTFGADPDTFSTTTDSAGDATFSGLPSGLYDVTVTDGTLGTTTGQLCARPDSAGGGAATVNYTDSVEDPSPSPSPSATASPSPSASPSACTPTPDSTDDFEFKWRIENLTGSSHLFRMRIVAVDGGTEYLEGPKSIGDTSDHEFKRKVDFKFDCFDVYIECESSIGSWSTVFLEDDLQAVRPTDTSKNDVKIHEFNGDPTDKDEAKSC